MIASLVYVLKITKQCVKLNMDQNNDPTNQNRHVFYGSFFIQLLFLSKKRYDLNKLFIMF